MAKAAEPRKLTEEEIKVLVTRLRHRGRVNPMFDDVSMAFERKNPHLGVKWEYAPPDSQDQFDVQTAEMAGYRTVMVSEIPEGVPTPHTQSSGPVRVADLILMAAPKELHEAYLAEDAKNAREASSLPKQEASFKGTLQSKGTTKEGKGSAYGGIKGSTEVVSVDLGAGDSS